jgi:hypothetical protein
MGMAGKIRPVEDLTSKLLEVTPTLSHGSLMATNCAIG